MENKILLVLLRILGYSMLLFLALMGVAEFS